jgi:lipoprotein-anchoring transpeptidase ErfK/SrfK
MTHKKPTGIDENLRLGIDAARTGHEKAAKQRLIAVLRQDPDNIPAMLWLAFVLPSPHDTIRVLNRVLALDPDNERAKAGIRWARGRLDLDLAQTDGEEPPLAAEPQPAVEAPAEPADVSPPFPPTPTDDASIRQQLLSGKFQNQARKGVLAHRARRTIRPLVGIILVSTILGLASIGVGVLAFVPPETLAAWLPAPVTNMSIQPEAASVESIESPVQTVEVPSASVAESFTSKSDTLTIVAPEPTQPVVSEPDSQVPLVEAESWPPVNIPPLPRPETNFTSIEPSTLLGPDLLSDDLQIPVMVDNLLLAHQPAYPGEKWIEVNLTTQQVIAWEGDKPVFSFLTSTGLPNTPTLVGEFHIYWKLKSTVMTGPGYYLPEVPYTMYFYGSYALHGTYWHNNFGQPMSHGCVNLETGNSEKLFEWADPVLTPGQSQVVATADNPGTLVIVHK